MIRWHFFGHTDPLGRGPSERVAKYDPERTLAGVGENIAGGYPSVRAACGGWMASSGHRENILDPEYAYIGSGYARAGRTRVYVQDFGVAATDLDPEPEFPPGQDFDPLPFPFPTG
jgi:uncharacterized protein YkwD